MTDRLLPSQKNEIFRLIEEAELNPADFHWGEVTLRRADKSRTFTVPALLHTSTGFYFAFGGRGGGGDILIYFSPDPRGHGWDPSETWYSVLGWVKTWLRDLHREIGERDLWGELAAQHQARRLRPDSGSNTPFTTDERARLVEVLSRLESTITETSRLSSEQHAILHATISEMKSTAERLGRKDWQMVAIGALASLVISGAFAPDQARGLANEFVQALSWLAEHAPMLRQ